MPIKIPDSLPATQTLLNENIFVMHEVRAAKQDIRPLRVALLNLMPTKIETETQFARLLSNSPLQVELTLLQTATYEAKNTSREHLLAFYETFEDVKERKFDGLVITGAPVELMEFEDVEYWDELKEIINGATNKDEAQALINQFDSEEEYWQHEFEVYKINLPIEKYLNSVKQDYLNNAATENVKLFL